MGGSRPPPSFMTTMRSTVGILAGDLVEDGQQASYRRTMILSPASLITN